jgi:hypothetical protein
VSHPIRTDSDRTRVLNNASTTIDHLLKIPHTINDLRQHMALRMNDGIRAAAYDGDPGRSSDDWSPTERAALLSRGDTAHDDLTQLDKDLRTLAELMDRWHGWGIKYPTYDREARKGLGDIVPGKGKCPKSHCQVCWLHGKPTEREGNFALWCDSCGTFKRRHGERPTLKAVWEIQQARGQVSLSDIRRLWPELGRKIDAEAKVGA